MAKSYRAHSGESGLTDDDRDRIKQYLQQPAYKRNADDLRPSADDASNS